MTTHRWSVSLPGPEMLTYSGGGVTVGIAGDDQPLVFARYFHSPLAGVLDWLETCIHPCCPFRAQGGKAWADFGFASSAWEGRMAQVGSVRFIVYDCSSFDDARRLLCDRVDAIEDAY